MPRTYLSADARCRQLERLVHQNPGLDAGQLAGLAGLAHLSTKAYMRRLVREKRVRVERAEPASPRGCLQWFYPLDPQPLKKAA